MGVIPASSGILPARKSRNDLPATSMYLPVAIDEIHRHIERVVDIALEAEAVLEDEGQHAGARVVDIGPDVAAIGQEAVGPALAERRIGEERGRDRLKRERDAELLHHVGFGAEVEIPLHRAGAEHHLEPIAADLGHVGAHDRVAALRHHRRFRERPGRREADAETARADFRAHLAHLMAMRVQLLAGVVHVRHRRAGELELPARLEAQRGAAPSERPMMLRPSMIGFQPKRCMPSRSWRMPGRVS